MANSLADLTGMIEKMPAGDIYLMADRRWVEMGFGLASRSSAVNIVWDGASHLLRMSVERFLVVVHCKDGRIKFACNCAAWSPKRDCPHVICAIVTLKKAVSPGTFPTISFSERYIKYLSEAMELGRKGHQPENEQIVENPNPMKDKVCLVIEKTDDTLDINIKKNGIPLYAYNSEMPVELRDLWMRSYGSFSGGKELIIEEFCRRFRNKYPVYFKDGAKEVPLSFDFESQHNLRIGMDASGGEITLSLLPDGLEKVDEGTYITRAHFFDLTRGTIGRVTENPAWDLWNEISEVVSDLYDADIISVKKERHRVTLSTDDFNKLQIQIYENGKKSFLQYCRLTIAGKESGVSTAEYPSYNLHAKEDENGQVKVVARGIIDNTEFYLSPKPFMLFTTNIIGRLSAPLRAKKRLSVLYDTFFSNVDSRSDRDALQKIKEQLNSVDFPSRDVAREGIDLLKHFLQIVRKPVNILMFMENNGWTLVPADPQVQVRTLEVPFRVFGVDIFMETPFPGSMLVPKETFTKGLPELYTRLNEAGFGLTYEDRPVTTVKWDFEIDAQRSSIDWFEIRPEIRCEGEAVDEAEFEKALRSGGFYDDGNSLKLLDGESLRLLSMVSNIGKGMRGKKEEVEIVKIPRLQILDWIMLRKEGVKVTLPREDEEIMESLLSFDKVPERPLPQKLNAKLRHYQKDGYNWLAFLYEHRFGACLADDMGLGKTLQTIALMAGLKEGTVRARHGSGVPHLVVVPPSLLFNWEHEISKFYPDLTVLIYQGKDRNTDFSGFDVVISTYDIVRRDIERLKDIQFHLIVFDEAQAVKNIAALTTSAVRMLTGDFRLAITGTPVENHIGEYYSIMDLAVPGLLGDIETLGAGKRKESVAEVNKVVRRTRPFVLRRTKQLISDELPPRIETDIYLDLTPEQKALYNRTVAEIKETVDDAYRSKNSAQARIIALTAILKLRQICLSPGLLLPEKKGISPKVDFLMEQLLELKDEGHSSLVFSQFTSFLNIVEDGMKAAGMAFSRLDGSTPVMKRKKMVSEFQSSDEPSAFLISLKAGGKGLNLTRATYVFHLDPWWNPAVENQASDRAHRIGQTSTVTVTRLIMRHTVEEKMMVLKEKKSRLYKALLEEGQGGEGLSISKDDFDFLIGD